MEKQLLKFEIYLKIKNFNQIFKNIKKRKFQNNLMDFIKVWESFEQCIVYEVNDCVLRKICESLNKFWKFYLKFRKFLNFFESLKNMLIKIKRKL